MRRLVIYFFLGFILLLLVSGCAGPGKASVSLNQEFTLSPGGSATIISDNITIKFDQFIADSRCPSNVVCVWRGDVSCLVEITKPGTPPYKVVLTQPGLTDEPATQVFDGHQAIFRVEPYPVSGTSIPQDSYRLIMRVIRSSERE